MTGDEILTSVLGEKSGYVWGKGYGKKPTKKNQTQQANIAASVSSAVESMRQEMQLDMERKLQEEREQMAAYLKRDMDQDLQKKLEEEREHMKGEVEKMFQEKMVALMAEMQQGIDIGYRTGVELGGTRRLWVKHEGINVMVTLVKLNEVLPKRVGIRTSEEEVRNIFILKRTVVIEGCNVESFVSNSGVNGKATMIE
ncbi:putative formin-like protein 3-like [Capsicum annuum]|nr:putative formin-like protein 3-like [Capsicum annuum]